MTLRWENWIWVIKRPVTHQTTTGCRQASHAREGMGILLVRSRRRDYESRKPCSISQVRCLLASSHVCAPISFSLRVWFRPRILRDVTEVDWSTTILGHRSSMPLYIVSIIYFKAFDLADNWEDRDSTWKTWPSWWWSELDQISCKAWHNTNGMPNLLMHKHVERRRQIPTLASCSFDEIVGAAQPGQAQFFQLFVFLCYAF